jgi:hypothetical protein
MAQAADRNTSISDKICELGIRIQLRKAGLRLQRSGFSYTILHGNQVLIAGNGHGEGLALDDVVAFVNRSLVR